LFDGSLLLSSAIKKLLAYNKELNNKGDFGESQINPDELSSLGSFY